MELSKRQTEKVGMAYVAERLYRDGLRFAVPDIDDGIDFIVYDQAVDRPFSSIPVQLNSPGLIGLSDIFASTSTVSIRTVGRRVSSRKSLIQSTPYGARIDGDGFI